MKRTLMQLLVLTMGSVLIASGVAATAQDAGTAMTTTTATAATTTATTTTDAQAAGNPVVLYGGEAMSSASVKVVPWGGGETEFQQGLAYTPSGNTIIVHTAGLYQGGQIMFPTPVSLGNLKADTSRYLQIIFSVEPWGKYPKIKVASSAASPTSSMVASSNSMGAYGSGGSYHYSYNGQFPLMAQTGPTNPQVLALIRKAMQRSMGNRGVPPGFMRGPGGPIGPAPVAPVHKPYVASAPPALPISSMHMILKFSDGNEIELLRPVVENIGDDIHWLQESIPLAAINANASDVVNAQLSEIYLGTDSPATITIGEIRTVSDTTPITADAGKPQTVPTKTAAAFIGAGDGGASMLKYQWDFDSPGHFVPEAEGNFVDHSFAKPGTYVVTLRVSDLDGLKKAALATVVVHATDQ